MSVIIRGGNANNTLGIDADGNALVNLPSDPTKIGGVKMYDGLGNPIVTTENGRSLRTAYDSILRTW